MSTRRQIQPIPLNGIVPGSSTTAPPIVEWLDPATLWVDSTYQRESSERSLKLVRKIISEFDWAKFKPPVGVLVDDGVELLDGQHSAIAAASHPGIKLIPVLIVDVPRIEERAGSFIAHNRDRISVTRTQLHTAAIAAGEAEATAVQRVCVEAGVTILRMQPGAGRYQPGSTVSIAAIAALIKARGEISAIKVLGVLARAGLAPINQTHIRAADALLHDPEYSTQITPESLLAAIQSMALKIDNEAAVFRAAHPSTPAWKAVAILWFRARRGGALKSQPSGGGLKTEASSIKPAENTITSRNDLIGTGDLKTASGKLIENITHRPSVVPPPRQSNRDDSCKRDSRPKLSGWIPGPVLRRCSGCDEKYTGDVKSKSCADCAYGCSEAVSA